MIKSNPEDALKIFIGDKATPGEVEQLPRPKVLNFFKKTEKSLVIPYLVSNQIDFTPSVKQDQDRIHGHVNKQLGVVLASYWVVSLILLCKHTFHGIRFL